MEATNSLSLRKLSNKVAAIFALVVVVVGIAVNHRELSDAFLYAASIIGLVWGTLRCMGFGERHWQNGVIIYFLVLIQRWLFPLNLENLGKTFLAMFTFYSIAILHLFFVVWLKEFDERKNQVR